MPPDIEHYLDDIALDATAHLGPLRPTDAAELFRAVNDARADLSRWLDWVDEFRTEDDAAAFIARTTAWAETGRRTFAIVDQGRLVGVIGHHAFVDDRVALGYWLTPTARGRGLAHRAVCALTRLTFDTTSARTVEIRTARDNEPSQRVARAAHFRLAEEEPTELVYTIERAPDATRSIDETFMTTALALAGRAARLGEVPVGALVVHDGRVVAEAFNERETKPSALAHAEVTAIARATEALGRWRLTGCTLYVTLEPCVMCAGAIVQARLDRVVYGAADPKAGAVESLYQVLADTRLNHRPAVTGGVLAEPCGRALREFFRARRAPRA